MEYDWDPANRDHLAKHNITPLETEQVLENSPFSLENEVVDGEERFTEVGETGQGRILVVVTTWRHCVRVITAWDAAQTTKRWYLVQRKKEWPL